MSESINAVPFFWTKEDEIHTSLKPTRDFRNGMPLSGIADVGSPRQSVRQVSDDAVVETGFTEAHWHNSK